MPMFQKFISPPDVFVLLLRSFRSQHISFDFEGIAKPGMFTNIWFDVVTINFASIRLDRISSQQSPGYSWIDEALWTQVVVSNQWRRAVISDDAWCIMHISSSESSQHLQPDAQRDHLFTDSTKLVFLFHSLDLAIVSCLAINSSHSPEPTLPQARLQQDSCTATQSALPNHYEHSCGISFSQCHHGRRLELERPLQT